MDSNSPKKMGDLKYRAIVNGLAGLLVILFIVIAELRGFRWIFTGAVAAIIGVALFEFYGLVKKKGYAPATTLGVAASVLYIFAIFVKTGGPYAFMGSFWQNGPEIILAITFVATFATFSSLQKEAIVNIATTLFGIAYVVIPLGLLIRIAYFFSYGGQTDPYFEGSFWLVYLLIVTKSADMGGYFIGRYYGRHQLALRLSPNKTLEGAIGGLVASTVLSLLICLMGKQFNVFVHFSYGAALIMGIIIGVLGQIGDLAESLLKRDAGVKDSNALPAVGGVLDMVDSLIFTVPVVYIFLKIYYTG